MVMWRLDIRLSCYRTPDFFVLSQDWVFPNKGTKNAIENKFNRHLIKNAIICWNYLYLMILPEI